MGFSATTQIQLCDSSNTTFGDLCSKRRAGHLNGFAVDLKTRLSTGCDLILPRVSGKSGPMVTVTLTNGDKIHCTPTQEFYLAKDLTVIQANELKTGDALLGVSDGPHSDCCIVDSVSNLMQEQVTYILSVPRYSNFMLACGVYARAH